MMLSVSNPSPAAPQFMPDLGGSDPITGTSDLTADPQFSESASSIVLSAFDLLNSYTVVFLAAFLVVLLATPVVRRLAIAAGVVDYPDGSRKMHSQPVPYLGGIAIFLGLIVAIALSYIYPPGGTAAGFEAVPPAIVLGMVAITFTGLADDVWGWDPRLKIAGQLVAAAALAMNNIGVRVAAGALRPLAHAVEPWLGNEHLILNIPLPGGEVIPVDLIYWTGTAIIAIFVLGGCNAANLLDGLDGLLSGTVAIVAIGLLAISLLLATTPDGQSAASLTGARFVLGFALLGAVIGFLPHNFNPASIFLGDCGSLLLGFLCATLILMLGEHGHTHLVFAGLIVFSVPIMDTTLAIIRRRLSGIPMSAADDQHIHHQLKRSLGGVKRAVFALYGIGAMFAVLGVTLAALQMTSGLRLRAVYTIAIVLFGFIGVIAYKAAQRRRGEIAAKTSSAAPSSPPAPPLSSSPTAKDAPAVPGVPVVPKAARSV